MSKTMVQLRVKLFRFLVGLFSVRICRIFRHTNLIRTLEEKQLLEFLYINSSRFVGAYYIDVGANVGDVAQKMAVIFRPVSTILIEPQPHLAEKLKAKFSDVKVIQAVIGGDHEFEKLYFNQGDDSDVSQAANIYERRADNAVGISVRNLTISNLDIQFEHGGVMKIDIEGAEINLLTELSEIHRLKNWCILVEDHAHLYKPVQRRIYRKNLKRLIRKIEGNGNLVIKWV